MTASDTRTTRSLVAAEFAPTLELFPRFDFSEGLEATRKRFEEFRQPVGLPSDGVRCHERFVARGDGAADVRVLHYEPEDPAIARFPAVLHIHGGGYVLGRADDSDAANRALARKIGCAVISVDYRLAPESPWPGALEECYAVLCWMHAKASQLRIDPSRIAVAGESAGGGHAVSLALHTVRMGGPGIRLLLLDAPMLDDRTGAPNAAEPHPFAGEFVWTPADNHFGWSSLLGVEAGGPDVPASAVPARAKSLSGLPATFISVGALDLFLEENLEFSRRLARAGVPIELHVVAGAFHGFTVGRGASQTRMIRQLRTQALERALECPVE